MAKFVLSKKVLLNQYKELVDKTDILAYSFKTNQVVGKILEKETNCWFTCHSFKFLKMIKNKSRVLFFAQGWNKRDINKLICLGVNKFVVDNENDLKILLNFLDENNAKILLFLRMRLKELTIRTGKFFVFGFTHQKINKLIPELRDRKGVLGLGVHVHRKTQNISEWSLKEEFSQLLTNETLKNIDFLDVGGGLPVDYVNSRSKDSLPFIFKKLSELRSWLHSKNIKLIMEPGRFLAAPCVRLECKVLNVYDHNIIVDCSVYNAAMDTFIANVRLPVLGEGEGEPFTIKGVTPDSIDIFRYKVFLKQVKKGDKLVFLNAGAYNFSTNFCGLKPLKTVIVDDFSN